MDQQTRQELQAISARATRLAEKLRALASAVAKVNAKTQRAGASVPSLTIGLHDLVIEWPQPWPDTSYGVWVSLQMGDAALSNVHAILKPGSKTTTQCIIRLRALALINATVGVDVLGVRT